MISGTVPIRWTTVRSRPASRPARAAANTMVRNMGMPRVSSSVAGESCGMPGIVGGVVEGLDVREADPEQDQDAQRRSKQRLQQGTRARGGAHGAIGG